MDVRVRRSKEVEGVEEVGKNEGSFSFYSVKMPKKEVKGDAPIYTLYVSVCSLFWFCLLTSFTSFSVKKNPKNE